jgi:hypothetical protein
MTETPIRNARHMLGYRRGFLLIVMHDQPLPRPPPVIPAYRLFTGTNPRRS